MHLDVSRDTFDPAVGYLRVVREQGSVDLDADANEQTAILLHRLHQLAADVYGPHWGPADAGFEVKVVPGTPPTLTVSRGRYYADGLCGATDPEPDPDKPQPIPYLAQPYDPAPEPPPGKSYLVYLEVWERVVSEAERRLTAWPPGRDPGLTDVPAAPRTRTAWRVRVRAPKGVAPVPAWEADFAAVLAELEKPAGRPKLPDFPTTAPATTLAAVEPLYKYFAELDAFRTVSDATTRRVHDLQPKLLAGLRPAAARLAARSAFRTGFDDNATLPFPVAEPTNQLYRVEIHRGGQAVALDPKAVEPRTPDGNPAATFKWSRDNGSVGFPVHPKWLAGVQQEGWKLAKVAGREPADRQTPVPHEVRVRLRTAPRDDEPALGAGDVVEYCDPVTTFRTGPLEKDDPRRLLFTVDRVHTDDTDDTDQPVVTAVLRALVADAGAGATVPERMPGWAFLRRWDNTGVPLDRAGLRDTARGPVLADDGALLVVAPPKPTEGWLDLDGVVQVRFEAGKVYQPGDYWLIPTRAATGDVIWPREKDAPDEPGARAATPAADVHLAPLALVDGGTAHDLRQLAVTPPLARSRP